MLQKLNSKHNVSNTPEKEAISRFGLTLLLIDICTLSCY